MVRSECSKNKNRAETQLQSFHQTINQLSLNPIYMTHLYLSYSILAYLKISINIFIPSQIHYRERASPRISSYLTAHNHWHSNAHKKKQQFFRGFVDKLQVISLKPREMKADIFFDIKDIRPEPTLRTNRSLHNGPALLLFTT